MNKVFLIGRLTRDPELRYTGNDTAVASFTVAVNRPFTNDKGERDADFIPVVVWRKQAENVKNYLSQGSQVAIEGRIQVRNYDDPNGQKRYVTEVIADNVEFIGSKGSSENSSNAVTSSKKVSSKKAEEKTPYDMEDAPTPKGTDLDDPYNNFDLGVSYDDSQLPF